MSGEWTPERVAKSKATREALGPRLGVAPTGAARGRYGKAPSKTPRATGSAPDAMSDGKWRDGGWRP